MDKNTPIPENNKAGKNNNKIIYHFFIDLYIIDAIEI